MPPTFNLSRSCTAIGSIFAVDFFSGKRLLLAFLFAVVSLQVAAQDFAATANHFISSLSPELRQRAVFEVEDPERYNIHFLPIARKGPTFHDFNQEQTEAAIALLRACLSEEGYRKTREIMELEKVLIVIENNRKMPDGSPMRDPLNYHFCIFGQPSPSQFWAWRFEGHHISLSFSSADNQIVSATPSFFGTNPAIVDVDGFGSQQVLKRETELGFELVNALDRAQLSKARFSDTAPPEIITRNKPVVGNLEPRGIDFKSLSRNQQALLLKLLSTYISNYEEGFARTFMTKIEQAGLDRLSFAWAGSLQPGKGHYYRIQGPVLLIEYDNTQNDANHVHTVVRDLTNDFGRDLLREHYHTDH